MSYELPKKQRFNYWILIINPIVFQMGGYLSPFLWSFANRHLR